MPLEYDLDERKLLFATPGRGAPTLSAAAADLRAHGGDPDAVQLTCMVDAVRWTSSQQVQLLSRLNLKTARWRGKGALWNIYQHKPSIEQADAELIRLMSWPRRCRLEPIKRPAAAIRAHQTGVLQTFVWRMLCDCCTTARQLDSIPPRRCCHDFRLGTFLIADGAEALPIRPT